MKIKCELAPALKGKPDGVLKNGSRLDEVIDALTTAQAAGAPGGANVTVGEKHVYITWEEDR